MLGQCLQQLRADARAPKGTAYELKGFAQRVFVCF